MVTDIRTRAIDTEAQPSGSGRTPDPIGAVRRWWIWGVLAFAVVAAGGSVWAMPIETKRAQHGIPALSMATIIFRLV